MMQTDPKWSHKKEKYYIPGERLSHLDIKITLNINIYKPQRDSDIGKVILKIG